MARIVVFLIGVFNILGLVVSSILGAASSGSQNWGWAIFALGGLWTIAFTYGALALCSRGKGSTGVMLALITWPMASVVGMVIKTGTNTYSDVLPNTPEFELACQSAGVKYLVKPAAPVRSIAYDWEGSHPPGLNYIKFASSGRIESSMASLPRFPPSIEFTEGRCCQHEGRPLNGIGPFIRRPNDNAGDYFGVTELTADALVTYKISKVSGLKEGIDFGQVDVNVTDRRDGRALANLRYISDGKNKKFCGSTSDGVMDEHVFVRLAVGLN